MLNAPQQFQAVFLCFLAQLFECHGILIGLPSGGFKRSDVLAQQGVAFAHDALGFCFAFWMVHHQLQSLFVDFRKEGMNRALYVMKRQQRDGLGCECARVTHFSL